MIASFLHRIHLGSTLCQVFVHIRDHALKRILNRLRTKSGKVYLFIHRWSKLKMLRRLESSFWIVLLGLLLSLPWIVWSLRRTSVRWGETIGIWWHRLRRTSVRWGITIWIGIGMHTERCGFIILALFWTSSKLLRRKVWAHMWTTTHRHLLHLSWPWPWPRLHLHSRRETLRRLISERCSSARAMLAMLILLLQAYWSDPSSHFNGVLH